MAKSKSVTPAATEAPAAKAKGKKVTKTAAPANGVTKAKEVAGAAKAEGNGHAVKDGLRKPQVRILRALAAANGPMTDGDLAEAADVPRTHVTGFTLVAYKSKRSPALVQLGLVRDKRMVVGDSGREARVYEITAAGRKAIDKLDK